MIAAPYHDTVISFTLPSPSPTLYSHFLSPSLPLPLSSSLSSSLTPSLPFSHHISSWHSTQGLSSIIHGFISHLPSILSGLSRSILFYPSLFYLVAYMKYEMIYTYQVLRVLNLKISWYSILNDLNPASINFWIAMIIKFKWILMTKPQSHRN